MQPSSLLLNSLVIARKNRAQSGSEFVSARFPPNPPQQRPPAFRRPQDMLIARLHRVRVSAQRQRLRQSDSNTRPEGSPLRLVQCPRPSAEVPGHQMPGNVDWVHQPALEEAVGDGNCHVEYVGSSFRVPKVDDADDCDVLGFRVPTHDYVLFVEVPVDHSCTTATSRAASSTRVLVTFIFRLQISTSGCSFQGRIQEFVKGKVHPLSFLYPSSSLFPLPHIPPP